jgi:membrane protease YdiL (CAAX protease family)
VTVPPDDEPYTGPPPTRPPSGGWPVPWHGTGPPQPVPPPGWGGPPPAWGMPPVGSVPQAFPVPFGAAPQAPPLPPGMRWEPPPGTPPHDEPQPFLRAMRSRTWAWWRPVAGLALLTVVYAVASVAVILVALVTGITPDLALLDLIDPWVLLVTNISLILFIPAVWLAWAVAHGMRIGWSASVLARIRPRLFAPYAYRALVTLGLGIVLSVGVGVLLDTDSVTGPVPQLGWLLLVVFLTTPLQSAAEEYLFRGYLSQMIAGWFRSERVGAITAAVVTAAAFSMAHAPPDFWTFLDRFVFALAASATVWLTGGLEAAIVLHAVNNVLVFGMAGLLGEGVATAEVPSGTGLLFVVITTVSMAAYVALVARSRDRLRPERWTPAQDLRPPWDRSPGPPPGTVAAPWQPVPVPRW